MSTKLKAKEAREDAREEYAHELGKLRENSRAAVARLDELKAASESTWHKMVAETEKVRTAFVSSFNDFKSQV